MVAKTICVIDDDEIYQFTIKHNVKKIDANIKVLKFTNGNQAFEYFSEHCNNNDLLPELILLDINMPVMDGWEFIEAYKTLTQNITKSIKIYMVSSSVDESDIKRAQSIPEITEFITKPVVIETLLAAMEY